MTLEPVSIENVPKDLLFEMQETPPPVVYTETAPVVSVLSDGVTTEIGDYAAGDTFTIHYDTAKVKFYKNGAVVQEAAAPRDLVLSADTAFSSLSGESAALRHLFRTVRSKRRTRTTRRARSGRLGRNTRRTRRSGSVLGSQEPTESAVLLTSPMQTMRQGPRVFLSATRQINYILGYMSTQRPRIRQIRLVIVGP